MKKKLVLYKIHIGGLPFFFFILLLESGITDVWNLNLALSFRRVQVRTTAHQDFDDEIQ